MIDKIKDYNHSFTFIDEILSWHTTKTEWTEVRHAARREGTSGYSLIHLIFLTLNLIFARATVNGKDRRVTLQRSGPDTFVGSLMPLETGKWYATLDDDSHSWRLVSSINIQDSATAHFKLGSPILAPADG